MVSNQFEHDLKESVRSIPDYPKPGIIFRDITTLLGNPRAFRRAIDELVQPWAGSKIDKVAGIEARGFIIGGAVAHQVSAGFVPIRKKGKLPHKRVSIAYSLEYGLDEMEMHEDAVANGDRVILVDDLIATGGTAEGAVKLLRQLGAQVLAACFIIDLPDLGGAERLRKLDVPVRTLIGFKGHCRSKPDAWQRGAQRFEAAQHGGKGRELQGDLNRAREGEILPHLSSFQDPRSSALPGTMTPREHRPAYARPMATSAGMTTDEGISCGEVPRGQALPARGGRAQPGGETAGKAWESPLLPGSAPMGSLGQLC